MDLFTIITAIANWIEDVLFNGLAAWAFNGVKSLFLLFDSFIPFLRGLAGLFSLFN